MLQRLFCLLALLGLTACVDPGSGSSTGEAAVYAYDEASKVVHRWNDLPAAFTAGSLPTPSSSLSSSLFDPVTPLAWGGMTLDDSRNRLYLVGESGDVVRIDRVRNLSGSLSIADVVPFKLDSAQRLTNRKFGQAAVDASTDTLYVTETGDNGTRIWVVTAASSRARDVTVSLQALQTSGDTGGYGVAAGQGLVYGSFQNGNAVGPDSLTGPRLRKGAGGSFLPTSVLVGNLTGLGKRGVLALDTSNSLLFVGLSPSEDSNVSVPVEVFRTGQPGGAYNQAPNATFGDPKVVTDLRVLAHAGNKDWLAGLSATVGATVWVWKAPSGGSPTFLALTGPTGAQLKGLVIDGNP